MKKFILILTVLFLFLTTCDQTPEPTQLEQPNLVAGPTVSFTEVVPEFTCGQAITKEAILAILNNSQYVSISADSQKPCQIIVGDFSIPAHTHGFVEIPFIVTDVENNLSKNSTISILIKEDKSTQPIVLAYNGPTPFAHPFGVDTALIINNLLADSSSGFSVTNSNGCEHQKGYTLIPVNFPQNGGHPFYKVSGNYNITFKIKSHNGVESNEITVSVEIGASDAKPIIYPPTIALEKEVESSVTNEDIINYIKANSLLFSSDPTINMSNVTFDVKTVADSSKLGTQRIYFTVTDQNNNQSDLAYIRLTFITSNPYIYNNQNVLIDPSFEAEPAPLAGSISDEFYRDKRLSSNWKINQTTMFFTNPFVGEGGGNRPNTPLNQKSKSITGNNNDLLQGPIILDPADFPSVSSFKEDKGYELVKDKSLYGLEGIATLKHMVLYRATEKKVTGTHSFALRGKSYDIGINKDNSSQTARFFGVGGELCQTVTLKKDDVCSFSAQIIKDFGHDASGELNGMVGAIYISLYKAGEPNNIIKELHIHSHCTNKSDYGQFKRYGSNTNHEGSVISEGTFAIPEDGNYVFSIRKYLSNDSGGKEESTSSWGYSPTYVDDCELKVTRLKQYESHIDEELQTPPTL